MILNFALPCAIAQSFWQQPALDVRRCQFHEIYLFHVAASNWNFFFQVEVAVLMKIPRTYLFVTSSVWLQPEYATSLRGCLADSGMLHFFPPLRKPPGETASPAGAPTPVPHLIFTNNLLGERRFLIVTSTGSTRRNREINCFSLLHLLLANRFRIAVHGRVALPEPTLRREVSWRGFRIWSRLKPRS